MPDSKPIGRAIRQNQPKSCPIRQNQSGPRLNFAACHVSQEHRSQRRVCQSGVLVEHKAQTHFEGFLRASHFLSIMMCDALMYFRLAVCVILLLQCTVRYSVAMSRPKPPHTVRYTVRLNRAQGERVAALKAQLHAKSDNEVFDYLVTVGTNQRDDLEQLVYSLFGNLADSLAHRFRSLETVSQLHLALTDTFIKYALTALPAVPSELMAGARARATKIYEQVNITAAREFQRRRESGAYSAAELGLEEE